MEKQRQEEIIRQLTAKGAIKPCPRCENPQFELVGETSIELNIESQPFWPSHPKMPVIILACNNCGYITYHAAGILDPPPYTKPPTLPPPIYPPLSRRPK